MACYLFYVYHLIIDLSSSLICFIIQPVCLSACLCVPYVISNPNTKDNFLLLSLHLAICLSSQPSFSIRGHHYVNPTVHLLSVRCVTWPGRVCFILDGWHVRGSEGRGNVSLNYTKTSFHVRSRQQWDQWPLTDACVTKFTWNLFFKSFTNICHVFFK